MREGPAQERTRLGGGQGAQKEGAKAERTRNYSAEQCKAVRKQTFRSQPKLVIAGIQSRSPKRTLFVPPIKHAKCERDRTEERFTLVAATIRFQVGMAIALSESVMDHPWFDGTAAVAAL